MGKKAERSDVSVKNVKTASGRPVTVKKQTPRELMSFVEKGGKIVGHGGSGEEYFMSQTGYYIKPQIDGKLVLDMTKNEYVALGVRSYINLCFTEKPKYHVYDSDMKEDYELALEMEKAFEHPSVELFSKMKLTAKDIYQWGCFLYQHGWIANMDGWVVPAYIRRLPPETFLNPPPIYKLYAELMKGICITESGEVQFWQTWSDNMVHKLIDVTILRDPTMPGLSGESKLIPVIPLVQLMDFCWKAQSQKINRVGAPALFVKFTQAPVQIPGKRDDLKLARLIMDNWGKEAQYVLRENMEIVQLDFPDNQSAIQTIEELRKDIMEHFNPATFLVKEGGTIGGADTGKMNLIKLAIQNSNAMIAMLWQPMCQEFLDRNGYEGYTVRLELPAPEPDRSSVNVLRAQAGFQMGVLTTDEGRGLLGFPEATPEVKAALEEEAEKKAQRIPGVKRPGEGISRQKVETANKDEGEG